MEVKWFTGVSRRYLFFRYVGVEWVFFVPCILKNEVLCTVFSIAFEDNNRIEDDNTISQQKEEIKCIELVSHFSGILSFRCFKLCIVCLQEGRSARWFLKACLKSLAVIGEQLLLEMSGYDLFDYTMYIAVHM